MEDFKQKAADNQFIEWEEVYAGTCYGTLRSEIDRIWSNNNVLIFDVDVKGGLNIKKIFGANALSIFIMPPSIEELRHRLTLRATDSPETIEKRVAKAAEELTFAEQYDVRIMNDKLEIACAEAEEVLKKFIKQ